MSKVSTYVKKIADGLYEYGLSFPTKNYRKQLPRKPVGTERTLREAEEKRKELHLRHNLFKTK